MDKKKDEVVSLASKKADVKKNSEKPSPKKKKSLDDYDSLTEVRMYKLLSEDL